MLPFLILPFSGCRLFNSNNETIIRLTRLPEPVWEKTKSIRIEVFYDPYHILLFDGDKDDKASLGPYSRSVTNYINQSLKYIVTQVDGSGDTLSTTIYKFAPGDRFLSSDTSLSIPASSLTINADAPDSQIIFHYHPKPHTSVIWRANDPRVVQVNNKGILRPGVAGQTQIIATLSNHPNFSDTLEVRVTPGKKIALDSIKFKKSDLTLFLNSPGVYLDYSVYPNHHNVALAWHSSDTSVAHVNESGFVAPRSEGTTKIALAAKNDPFISDTIAITIQASDTTQQVEQVRLKPDTVLFILGEKAKPLSLFIKPEKAPASIKYAIGDSSIASINSSGLIQPLSQGQTRAYATVNGKSHLTDSSLIIVNQPDSAGKGSIIGSLTCEKCTLDLTGIPLITSSENTLTGPDGSFTLDGLLPGIHTVHMAGIRFQSLSRDFLVEAGKTTQAGSIKLTPLDAKIKSQIKVTAKLEGPINDISSVLLLLHSPSRPDIPLIFDLTPSPMQTSISKTIQISDSIQLAKAELHIKDKEKRITGIDSILLENPVTHINFETVNTKNALPIIESLNLPDSLFTTEPFKTSPAVKSAFGLPARYVWTFGPGDKTLQGRHINLTVNDSGRFNVSLKVTDAQGNETTKSKFVVFRPRLPDSVKIIFNAADNGSFTDGAKELVQTIPYGQNSTAVSPMPSTGYDFSEWSGDTSSSNPNLIFKQITSNKTVTARFKKLKYSVVFISGRHGKLSGQKDTIIQMVEHGQNSSSVAALPGEGYIFKTWSGDTSSTQNILEFVNVTQDKSVKAEFEKSTFTLTFESAGNGMLNGESSSLVRKVRYGENSEEVTAVPDADYVFDNWTGDTATSNAALAFTNVTQNKRVQANFKLKSYDVTFVAPENGHLSGGLSEITHTVTHGKSSPEVEAIPNTGYQFTQWEGNASHTANPIVLANITASQTLRARFEKIQVDLIFTSTIGGTVNDSTEVRRQIPFGDTLKNISALPSPGYRFSCWMSGNDTISYSANLQIDSVHMEKTYSAHFNPVDFSLHIISAGNGNVNNQAPFQSIITYGIDSVELEAQPDSGFVFQKWRSTNLLTADFSSDVAGAQSTVNPIVIKNILYNDSLHAYFRPTHVTVTFVIPTKSGTEWLENPVDQNIVYGGDTHPFTHAPVEGYMFKEWNTKFDGAGATVSTDSAIILYNNLKDTTIYAVVDSAIYDVRISRSGNGRIQLQGSTYIPDTSFALYYGENIFLRAVPDSGNTFSHWTGNPSDSTNPEISASVKNHSHFKAFFQSN